MTYWQKLLLGLVDNWRRSAICAQIDPELFYSSEPEDKLVAISICETCPVMAQCRNWGDKNEHDYDIYGVLGGETSRQRAIRRKINNHTNASGYTQENTR